MNDDIKSNDRIGVGTRLLLRSIAIGERVRFFTEKLSLYPFLIITINLRIPPSAVQDLLEEPLIRKIPAREGTLPNDRVMGNVAGWDRIFTTDYYRVAYSPLD